MRNRGTDHDMPPCVSDGPGTKGLPTAAAWQASGVVKVMQSPTEIEDPIDTGLI